MKLPTSFALLALSSSIFAQDVSDELAAAIESGRSSITALMEEQHIPGLSFAIAKDGKLLWSEGFGYANVEGKLPVTTDTRFRFASVSKVLTAACAAKLLEQGKLDLDAPVQDFVPSFPDKGHTISARMLLGHLSGIRHYKAKDHGLKGNIDLQNYASVTAGLAIFADDELLSVPGAEYHYSTFAFSLLAAQIEGAAKTDFLAYMQKAVLDPLRMKATGPDRFGVTIPNRTHFYQLAKDGENVIPAVPLNPSYKWAGGGLIGTAEDLIRFGTAHLRPGYFKAQTLHVLFTRQRTTAGKQTRTGLTWVVGKDAKDRNVVSHNGAQQGCHATLAVYPESGIVFAMLSNRRAPDGILKVGQRLAEPFFAAIEAR